MKKLILISLLVLFAGACVTGGIEDRYIGFHGKATITEVKQSVYNPDGKGNYFDIYFDFVPDEKDAPGKYRFKKWKDTHQRLFYNHRGNLHRSWVEKYNVKKGNVYRAMRYEKNCFGSSAPVIFKVLVAGEEKE